MDRPPTSDYDRRPRPRRKRPPSVAHLGPVKPANPTSDQPRSPRPAIQAPSSTVRLGSSTYIPDPGCRHVLQGWTADLRPGRFSASLRERGEDWVRTGGAAGCRAPLMSQGNGGESAGTPDSVRGVPLTSANATKSVLSRENNSRCLSLFVVVGWRPRQGITTSPLRRVETSIAARSMFTVAVSASREEVHAPASRRRSTAPPPGRGSGRRPAAGSPA